MKGLRYTLYTLLLVIVIASIAGGFLWLTTTEPGLKTTFGWVRAWVPGQLTVKTLRGTLSKKVQLSNLHYRYKHTHIFIHSLTLDWRPLSLIHRTLHIKKFDIHGTKIYLPDSEQSTTLPNTWPSLPELPFYLKIKTFNLSDIILLQGKHKKLLLKELKGKATLAHAKSLLKNTLEITQLSGTLQTTPFKGKLYAVFKKNKISALNANLHIDTGEFNIKGKIADTFDLSWHMHLPRIITSNGKITGPRKAPHLMATVHGGNIKIGDSSIGRLDGTFNIKFSDILQSQLQLDLHQLRYDRHNIPHIRITGNSFLSNNKTNFRVNIAPAMLHYFAEDKAKTINLQLTGGTILFTTHDDNTYAVIDMGLFGRHNLHGKLVLKNYALDGLPTGDEKLHGQIKWQDKKQHDILATLVPYVSQSRGQLSAEIKLNGKLFSPKLTGHLYLKHGQAKIPDINITARNITMRIDAKEKALDYQASALLGQNTLRITGQTQLDQKGFPSKFRLSGQQLLVSNTPSVQLYASPDLTFTTQGNQLYLNGTVLIPRALIHQPNFGDVVELPDNVVYIPPPKDAPDYYALHTQVTLILRHNIHLSYEGLSAKLTGQLTIHDTPQKTTTANGKIQAIDGLYTIHGRQLTIKQGDLIFNNSPINNPELDIRATRAVKRTVAADRFFGTPGETILVGVDVSGVLNRPQLRLFSNPSGISQSNLLSYLVMGEPANPLKPEHSKKLISAANKLNIESTQGGGGITDSVRQGLGLTDIGIYSAETADGEDLVQHSSVILGRYLTPQLYISYSIGLLDTFNTFKIRYQLRKNWSIQATNNAAGSGGDLIYSREAG